MAGSLEFDRFPWLGAADGVECRQFSVEGRLKPAVPQKDLCLPAKMG